MSDNTMSDVTIIKLVSAMDVAFLPYRSSVSAIIVSSMKEGE